MAVKAKRNAGTVKPAVKRAVNSAAKQSVPADTKPVAKKAPAGASFGKRSLISDAVAIYKIFVAKGISIKFDEVVAASKSANGAHNIIRVDDLLTD